MKSLETLFGSADINSFELQADFEQAVEACKNNIINKKADPALVNAKPCGLISAAIRCRRHAFIPFWALPY